MSAIRTAIIRNTPANLIRDGERPVYVMNDGRFAVKDIDGEWIVKGSLKAIDKFLASKVEPFKVFTVDYYGNVQVYEIIGFKGEGRRRRAIRTDGTPIGAHYLHYYHYDEQLIKAIKILHAEQATREREFSKRRDALYKKRKPADSANPY